MFTAPVKKIYDPPQNVLGVLNSSWDFQSVLLGDDSQKNVFSLSPLQLSVSSIPFENAQDGFDTNSVELSLLSGTFSECIDTHMNQIA